MDYRAYHLQGRARNAVAKAIREGSLIRSPCEVCGAVAQAHHDSYHPDKWLVIRWLCGMHHRSWHAKNEPEWPTVFDFHPNDELYPAYPQPGRPTKPWLRKSSNTWYVTIGRKQIPLGRNHEAAIAKFQELLRMKSAH